ncbi:MAG: histidine phosphatase family protein [Oscillospiraceae bacterium]|jgi:alpha-ribazole phosphatase|nr:histidine phosphatase family protein [Oscillospiraceae bacterium]
MILLRHAATAGNLARRYIGATDEPLCDTGHAAVRELAARIHFVPQRLYVSPLRRCVETARVVFPGAPIVELDGLREANFGAFEGRSYEELRDMPEYQRWLDSGGEIPPPGGDTVGEVRAQVLDAWETIRANCHSCQRIALVVHGGTIMTLMQAHLQGGLFDWQVSNCGGFIVHAADNAWTLIGGV